MPLSTAQKTNRKSPLAVWCSVTIAHRLNEYTKQFFKKIELLESHQIPNKHKPQRLYPSLPLQCQTFPSLLALPGCRSWWLLCHYMGAGDSPKYPPDKEKEARPPPSSPAVVERECFSDVRLADAPILLLICFHEALREELADLHHLAVTASERGSHGRELIVELRRRFDFLKLAYKYHCAAEDEVNKALFFFG